MGGRESEGTPVNVLKKGFFCYPSVLLYSSIPSYWSIITPSVNTRALVTLMKNAIWRERHLLSNNADIEATNNNAIEYFLYVESFRDKQKICLNLVRSGQDVCAILPMGSGRS